MKFLIISVTIVSTLFITCKKNDVECFDTLTRSFFPNKENQKLLDNIAGKTLQYRDSLGNKLDFNVGQILTHYSKFFYQEACGFHDWTGVGDHYLLFQPTIYLVSSGILISYNLSYYLEKVYPDPIGAEILTMCIFDSTQICNFAIAELSRIGNPFALNNHFQNIYLGNLTFTIKKHVSDTIGAKHSFQNVWKAAFILKPLSNSYHHTASKDFKLYSVSNERIPHEFYFNNTHGLIAFRFKDGALWMQYGAF